MTNPISKLKKIDSLRPQDLNCNIFSVYDYDACTIQELLCQFFDKINQCIEVSNATFKLAEWLVNEGLAIEVAKKLELWLEDGTLSKIINEVIFKELNDKVNGLYDKIEGFDERISNIEIDIKDYPRLEGETNDNGRFDRIFAKHKSPLTISIREDMKMIGYTILKDDVVIRLKDCTLHGEDNIIRGRNFKILGDNGKIYGGLKTFKVTKEAQIGDKQLTVDSTANFEVGEKIYSSYGLYDRTGGDAAPVTITAKTPTTLSFEVPVSEVIPVGATSGNISWGVAFDFKAPGGVIKDLLVHDTRGYAINCGGEGSSLLVENVEYLRSGTDTMWMGQGSTVTIKNTHFGYIVDPAKQAISLYERGKLYVENSTFKRSNFDVELNCFGVTRGLDIEFKNCKFDGNAYGNAVGIYEKKSWTVVSLPIEANSSIARIKFDNCSADGYSQGFLTKTDSGHTNDVVFDEIELYNCRLKNVPLGNIAYLKSGLFLVRDCEFDMLNLDTTENYFMSLAPKYSLRFRGCIFKNIKGMLLFEHGAITTECEFHGCKPRYDHLSSSYRCYYRDCQIMQYPHFEPNAQLTVVDATVDHNKLYTGNLSEVFSMPDRAVIKFKTPGSQFTKIAYTSGGVITFATTLELVKGAEGGLVKHDVIVPVNSEIKLINMSEMARNKYVTHSEELSVNSAAINGTTVTLTSPVTLFSDGGEDIYMTVLGDNKKVSISTVASISSDKLTITLSKPLIADTGKWGTACIFKAINR